MSTRRRPTRHEEQAPAPQVEQDNTLSDDNSASTLIESPVGPGEAPLKRHDFPDGGGSGGAEAFRRDPKNKRGHP